MILNSGVKWFLGLVGILLPIVWLGYTMFESFGRGMSSGSQRTPEWESLIFGIQFTVLIANVIFVFVAVSQSQAKGDWLFFIPIGIFILGFSIAVGLQLQTRENNKKKYAISKVQIDLELNKYPKSFTEKKDPARYLNLNSSTGDLFMIRKQSGGTSLEIRTVGKLIEGRLIFFSPIMQDWFVQAWLPEPGEKPPMDFKTEVQEQEEPASIIKNF